MYEDYGTSFVTSLASVPQAFPGNQKALVLLYRAIHGYRMRDEASQVTLLLNPSLLKRKTRESSKATRYNERFEAIDHMAYRPELAQLTVAEPNRAWQNGTRRVCIHPSVTLYCKSPSSNTLSLVERQLRNLHEMQASCEIW